LVVVVVLASGAPYEAKTRRRFLLEATALAADRREAELAARRSEARRARGRQELVVFAQDAAGLKDEEGLVEEKEQRVAALEAELRGVESGGGSGDEEEGEEEEEEEEDDDGK
jgi:hypothetical protein